MRNGLQEAGMPMLFTKRGHGVSGHRKRLKPRQGFEVRIEYREIPRRLVDASHRGWFHGWLAPGLISLGEEWHCDGGQGQDGANNNQ